MKSYSVEETTVINAPADRVYSIISDYDEGHRAILPEQYFDEMIVTKGGKGAGTELIVRMTVMGVKAEYNMVVTEPESGRILEEADHEAGTITTFIVDPLQNNSQSRVTIRTQMPVKPGLQGWIEKLMNPPIMRRIWRQELGNLAKVAEAELQPTAS